ncbi:MAG: hypothetical protein Q4C95_08800 [Planctomycetia bacterium]|nr:hypothetical protein [Planctomycetia bacterium]
MTSFPCRIGLFLCLCFYMTVRSYASDVPVIQVDKAIDIGDSVAVRILKTRLRERNLTFAPEKSNSVRFELDSTLALDEYRISLQNETIILSASEKRGFVYAVGKLLRGTPQNGEFRYFGETGTFSPKSPMRGVYFATHFGNFHESAPLSEVERYIEDMALYGVNILVVWFDFHQYSGIDDPNALAMIERLHAMLRKANEVGMAGGLTLLANEAYYTSPQELRAEPFPHHYKVEICPSDPKGLDLICQWRAEMLDQFADLDIRYICVWPYDQGGCRCERCAPWGCNGFLKCAEAIARIVREKLPQAKIFLSTWEFGYFYPDDLEWKGLYTQLNERPDWIDGVLIEHHGDFPAFVLQNGPPKDYPIVNFPEISMYAMSPWGGFGANLQCNRLIRVWNSAKTFLSGGFPYSEGIYEDINKFICIQLYWSPDRSLDSILKEYVQANFGLLCEDDLKCVLAAIMQLETQMAHSVNQQKLQIAKNLLQESNLSFSVDGNNPYPEVYKLGSDPSNMGEPLKLLANVSERLPETVRKSWRWQVLWCRAVLDDELIKSGGRPTETSENCLKILSEIYHDNQVPDDVVPWIQVPRVGRK